MTEPRPSLRSARAATRAKAYTATRFFLNLRLASRVTVGVSAATTGRPELVAAALACAVYDVLFYLALRRGLRIPLTLRLVLDAADVAIWSVVAGPPLDAPALVAAPLAFEVGLLREVARLPVPAPLVVPLVVGAAANAALLATGALPGSSPLIWPGFAAAAGCCSTATCGPGWPSACAPPRRNGRPPGARPSSPDATASR